MISWRSRAGAILGGLVGAAVAWGWFEAGWLRLRRLDVAISELPDDLAGLRIVHLSDFHLGVPSRGRSAVEHAVQYAVGARPDLVAVTGDLVSRPQGQAALRRLLGGLECCYAVLGNHDIGLSRDPFSQAADLTNLAPAQLLNDEAKMLELRGRRIQLVGVDPRTFRRRASRPWRLADDAADLRILLCHFPTVLDRLPRGIFHLVLAGHMHDGQISMPLPGGKLRFAHPRARYTAGLYERAGTLMHVSPGLGTAFVPLRFFARPEATELVLQRAT
jgi:predicted MPP superfamily phosphohydrolase